jgi:hypothetical protein
MKKFLKKDMEEPGRRSRRAHDTRRDMANGGDETWDFLSEREAVYVDAILKELLGGSVGARCCERRGWYDGSIP